MDPGLPDSVDTAPDVHGDTRRTNPTFACEDDPCAVVLAHERHQPDKSLVRPEAGSHPRGLSEHREVRLAAGLPTHLSAPNRYW